MKKNIKFILAITLFISSLIVFDTKSVFANEKYFYKGAAYATKLTTAANKTYNSSSSMIVVNASANYTSPSGKEQVLVYSRCELVKTLTGAKSCYVRELTTRFSVSNSLGVDVAEPNFITLVAPRVTASKTNLAALSYFINPTLINSILYSTDILIMGASAHVVHSYTDNNSAARVIFKNPDLSQTDISSAYAYKEIPFKLPNKGLYANFAFRYNAAKNVNVAVKASATYNLTINTGSISPLVIDAYTADAVLVHTIGS